MVDHLRLGTRGSALAMAQSGHVAAEISRVAGISVELVTVLSAGDNLAIPLNVPGQPGLFVAALRDRLLCGDVDLVVHSYKDLPSAELPGLRVAAVPPREDRRDVLVSVKGQKLGELASGSRVGTSSPRRAAAIGRLFPTLEVVPVRGNVDTRIAAVAAGKCDAVMLARAGMIRLGRQEEATEILDPEVFLPAPGQGALAVECRSEDSDLIGLLARLDDPRTRLMVDAERAVLSGVAATCATAVGATAWLDTVESDDELRLRLVADLANHNGVEYARVEVRHTLTDALLGQPLGSVGKVACELGAEAAERLLAGER